MTSSNSGSATEQVPLWWPFLLSTFAGSATAIGGCIVYFMRESPSSSTLAFFLAFAAGVMTTVSFLDLYIPLAFNSLGGFIVNTAALLGGAWACTLLDALPVPDAEQALVALMGPRAATASGAGAAGTHTGRKGSIDGSSTVSSTDVEAGAGGGGHAPLVGASLASSSSSPSRRAAWRLGFTLAAVLTIHNAPEGMAVGLGAVKSPALGLLLASSIFVHNVAEGFLVAVPVLAGTGSRALALTLTAVSGLSEPIGAVLGVLFMRTWVGDTLLTAIDLALAGVAGVMIQISSQELLPQAWKHAGGGAEEGTAAAASWRALAQGTPLALRRLAGALCGRGPHLSPPSPSKLGTLAQGLSNRDVVVLGFWLGAAIMSLTLLIGA